MPADPRYPTAVFPPDDDDLENADWTKRTWDLPTDKTEFLAFLRQSDMTVAEFKTWPVYRWNVDKIAWLRDLSDEDQLRATRFTLRGQRGMKTIDLTWEYGARLSGDEDAAAMVRDLAESHEGQLVGPGGGPYTTHRHLESPYSAYALMRMVFAGGRPRLVAGGLPPLPPPPEGAIR